MKILCSYFAAFVFIMLCSFRNLPVVPQEQQVYQQHYDNSLQFLRNILDFGKSRGWSTVVQDRRFNLSIAQFPDQSITAVADIIKVAKTTSAQFFALKSLLDGDDYETIQRFIGELNEYDEAYQQEHCLVFSEQGLVQKWQYSCSIAVTLTLMSELNPRYAWDVKKVDGYNMLINDPENAMAQQEKILLEKYGGISSPRGDVSGRGIPINEPINDIVGAVMGIRFYTQKITGTVPDALVAVRGILDGGMAVPALINFLPSETSHFILFLRSKYEGGQYHFLIYEPWEGKCAYVSSSNIAEGSLSPLLSQWNIRLMYYYPNT